MSFAHYKEGNAALFSAFHERCHASHFINDRFQILVFNVEEHHIGLAVDKGKLSRKKWPIGTGRPLLPLRSDKFPARNSQYHCQYRAHKPVGNKFAEFTPKIDTR
jgi:hypothetical protein